MLLDLLAQTNDVSLVDPALELISSDEPQAVRRAGLRVLSHFDEPLIIAKLMELHFLSGSAALHSQIRDILLSRKSSARIWLMAVDRGEIKADVASLEQVRRVALLEDEGLNAWVMKHWGQLHPETPEEKLAEVRRLNNDLRAASGNVSSGKLVFNKHCAACHTLFGEGGKIGPDLTTANRKDRDFLLISLVDPDYVIRREYVSVIIQTTDGRILTGLPVTRDDADNAGVTLVNAKNEQVVVAPAEIEELRESQVSIMPSDLYRQLKPQELRDLLSYMQSETGM